MSNATSRGMDTKHTIDQLNVFLRGELAAVETYTQALAGRSTFSAKTELSTCQRSHEMRAEALKGKIASLGGDPAPTSGIWGAWERAIEAGAVALGDNVAISALEQGEDHVLASYRKEITRLEPDVRTFVETKLLPEEERTHRTMSDLKHSLASA
jgi:demethoxyubiquinone hydroxylase (CLK1/Coq7/Cat5 family)